MSRIHRAAVGEVKPVKQALPLVHTAVTHSDVPHIEQSGFAAAIRSTWLYLSSDHLSVTLLQALQQSPRSTMPDWNLFTSAVPVGLATGSALSFF